MEVSDFVMSDVPDPYKCIVNICVPRGKKRKLQQIISPLVQWIDPSFQIINILEKSEAPSSKPKDNLSFSELDTPSMSIMLFLHENGVMCASNVENSIHKAPWTLHHKVHLENRRTPDHPIAKQEFFKLSDDLPLWAVCPVHFGNEHLRINLYVRQFQAMVEFYRLITDLEIESSKPEFCIFQLYCQPGLDIQLSLKYSSHLTPHPPGLAFLTFKVKNVDMLKTMLNCDITEISRGEYSVRDPDGNKVILKDAAPTDTCYPKPNEAYNLTDICEDVKSMRSVSDSHDSGRYSDSDICSSDVDQLMAHGQNGNLNDRTLHPKTSTKPAVSPVKYGGTPPQNKLPRPHTSRYSGLKSVYL